MGENLHSHFKLKDIKAIKLNTFYFSNVFYNFNNVNFFVKVTLSGIVKLKS